MIISRTPFRTSFFGGGTDYPVWYKENGGAVLGTTIDKYCYITCRYLPPFFEHKHRIVYSQTELTRDIDEIRHSSVRETLKFLGITEGVEIHHDGGKAVEDDSKELNISSYRLRYRARLLDAFLEVLEDPAGGSTTISSFKVGGDGV